MSLKIQCWNCVVGLNVQRLYLRKVLYYRREYGEPVIDNLNEMLNCTDI